jgi:F-type H+-transporting ATPase subunit b
MLNLAILAAEEEPSGLDLVLPETKELIAGIVAFLIVFAFVRFFAWPRLIRPALEARQQAITGQLRQAENAKQEAESLLSDYQAQVAGAREEATGIIEEARSTAESMRSDIVARAEAEAVAILERARAETQAEKERASSALRLEVADLSLDMAEKVVGRSIDRDAQRALVERYLEDLGGMSN